jgi:hypothetical protein
MRVQKFFATIGLTLALLALALVGGAVVLAQSQGSISGVVYCDADHDWSYDAGEEVAGVAVTLYDDATCDYVPDDPARAVQDSAADGTYSFTGLEVGADYGSRECYFVEVDEDAAELGTCNFLDWNTRYVSLYDIYTDVTENFRFQQIWDKTVNGQPWVPDMTVTAETSDTLQVIDVIFLDMPDRDPDETAQVPEFVLVETWNPLELDLIDVEWNLFTEVISSSGSLTWTVPWYQTPIPTATLTKTFHVEPCTWASTTLVEELYQPGEEAPELMDERPVVVEKTQPDLWIDSTYNSEVSPGEIATFTLSYGNNGGFENISWIRNEFPSEAPFDSANPAPDRQAGDGSWVEWDLGSLGTGDAGTIDVNVAIQAGLAPSTTMIITDDIYNHAEEVAGSTEITFHILQPPLSLGDFVWYDTDQDGIQDAGEPGVAGINVDLYQRECTGDALASDTTDANGNYLFEDLSPGIYCLQFSNIPAGWSITAQNLGADEAVDSDADPLTAQITDINLLVTDLHEDMGIYTVGSIGDMVFCDANNSGAYDAGEGVAAVAITLYDDPGCDGVAVNQLAVQDSGADGSYLFGNLMVGPPEGLPACYVSEVDENDSDLGDCNILMGPGSHAVQLDADNPDYLDADYGFNHGEPTPIPTPSPTVEPVPPPVIPEASTLVLLGTAASGLAGYIGLHIRARRRKED